MILLCVFSHCHGPQYGVSDIFSDLVGSIASTICHSIYVNLDFITLLHRQKSHLIIIYLDNINYIIKKLCFAIPT